MDLTYWLEQNKGQATETLKELVRIKSDAGDPVHTPSGEVFPFGQGVQDAFVYMLSKGSECGFSVRNVDNYGGHIEWAPVAGRALGENRPPSSEIIGILGHLDVVPAQEGWSFDPFGGEEVTENGGSRVPEDSDGDGEDSDGAGNDDLDSPKTFLHGRGTTDDKGPLVAVFYALKALKDAGYQPRHRIRLILGLDEEGDCQGMHRYLDEVGAPNYGFTPDGDFPADHGEMGMILCEIARKLNRGPVKGLSLTRLSGGLAHSIVPDKARAVVKADKGAYEVIRQNATEFERETGHRIRCRGVGKSLELVAEGRSSHGAEPWNGLNAIAVLFDFLGRLNFVSEDLNEFIQFYNRHLGYALDGSGMAARSDTKALAFASGADPAAVMHGTADSIAPQDPAAPQSQAALVSPVMPEGTIWNNGMVSYDGDSVTLNLSIRYPEGINAEEVYDAMTPVLDEYNLGVLKLRELPPHSYPKDHPLVETLVGAYRDVTGDLESEPLVISGETYAKCCENVIAFGGLFPGDPDIMHQKDEKIDLHRFYQTIEIYAEAIQRLDQMAGPGEPASQSGSPDQLEPSEQSELTEQQ